MVTTAGLPVAAAEEVIVTAVKSRLRRAVTGAVASVACEMLPLDRACRIPVAVVVAENAQVALDTVARES